MFKDWLPDSSKRGVSTAQNLSNVTCGFKASSQLKDFNGTLTRAIFCSKIIQLSSQALQHSWHITQSILKKVCILLRDSICEENGSGSGLFRQDCTFKFLHEVWTKSLQSVKAGEQQLKSLFFWLVDEFNF